MKEKYFVIGESRNGGQRHASVWIGVDEWNSQFYS